jgi:hypothetical protein
LAQTLNFTPLSRPTANLSVSFFYEQLVACVSCGGAPRIRRDISAYIMMYVYILFGYHKPLTGLAIFTQIP